MTVVDHVSPWLTPRSALARSTDPPTRRRHQEERDRRREQPPDDQDRFAPDAVGETPRDVVRKRLRDAEDDDERQNGALRREMKFVLGDRGEDRPLHPDHRANEGVDDDEQRELREVCPNAELRRRNGRRFL